MNIAPISAKPERHVAFAQKVEVRHIQPETPSESTVIQPSLHAQRLERALRTQQVAPARPRVIEQEVTPNTKECAPKFKKAAYLAACICGAFIIPSFSFLFLGPIGLVVPAALAVSSVILFALAGKPTPEMEQDIERTRQAAREWDSCI